MSWMKNKIVQMALVAILAAVSTWCTKGILSQQGKEYEYKGVKFTVPQEVITQGTNQVAIWTIKLKTKIDEMKNN